MSEPHVSQPLPASLVMLGTRKKTWCRRGDGASRPPPLASMLSIKSDRSLDPPANVMPLVRILATLALALTMSGIAERVSAQMTQHRSWFSARDDVAGLPLRMWVVPERSASPYGMTLVVECTDNGPGVSVVSPRLVEPFEEFGPWLWVRYAIDSFPWTERRLWRYAAARRLGMEAAAVEPDNANARNGIDEMLLGFRSGSSVVIEVSNDDGDVVRESFSLIGFIAAFESLSECDRAAIPTERTMDAHWLSTLPHAADGGLSGFSPVAPARAGDQRLAAEALSRGADECLLDVRDRDLTWEGSLHCASLARLVTAYIALGGFLGDEIVDARANLTAERARATAWMARATSLAHGQPLRIW